jgi:hypothetical protein
VEQLIPGFERKTGYKVKATFGSGLGTKQQVVKGEPFDVPIVQPPFPQVLASGNVVADSAKTLASVSVGVAVRPGAPKPDISTADAVRRTLLAAKSVSYPNPARGGSRCQLRRDTQEAGDCRPDASEAPSEPKAARWRWPPEPDVRERNGRSGHRHRGTATERDFGAHDAGGVHLFPRERSGGGKGSAGISFLIRGRGPYRAQHMQPGK